MITLIHLKTSVSKKVNDFELVSHLTIAPLLFSCLFNLEGLNLAL